MKNALSYPPPWQDAPTLCAHLSISEGTIDNWVRGGLLPKARMIGGKRMWEWAEVERQMRGDVGIVPAEETRAVRQVFDAARKAVNAR